MTRIILYVLNIILYKVGNFVHRPRRVTARRKYSFRYSYSRMFGEIVFTCEKGTLGVINFIQIGLTSFQRVNMCVCVCVWKRRQSVKSYLGNIRKKRTYNNNNNTVMTTVYTIIIIIIYNLYSILGGSCAEGISHPAKKIS